MCGQYKEFREFYAKGTDFKLNFTTDDVITRRGFLMRVSPTVETQCPDGSERFSSEKCVKMFNQTKVNWNEAQGSCQSIGGRLFNAQDFVDNLKLNDFITRKANEANDLLNATFWSSIVGDSSLHSNNKNKHSNYLNVKLLNSVDSKTRCLSKSLTQWKQEKCLNKHFYICEINPVLSKTFISKLNLKER
jgi:hypothetical protein